MQSCIQKQAATVQIHLVVGRKQLTDMGKGNFPNFELRANISVHGWVLYGLKRISIQIQIFLAAVVPCTFVTAVKDRLLDEVSEVVALQYFSHGFAFAIPIIYTQT